MSEEYPSGVSASASFTPTPQLCGLRRSPRRGVFVIESRAASQKQVDRNQICGSLEFDLRRGAIAFSLITVGAGSDDIPEAAGSAFRARNYLIERNRRNGLFVTIETEPALCDQEQLGTPPARLAALVALFQRNVAEAGHHVEYIAVRPVDAGVEHTVFDDSSRWHAADFTVSDVR